MRSRFAFAALVLAAPIASASAQALPPVAEQMTAAVLPLPADLRAGATIMGYKTKGKLETLRPGTNGMICLALYVTRPDFHVACYAKTLEPFMARGRELREEGVTGGQVDSVRFKEIASGKLKMPKQGALYTITTPRDAWDPKAGVAKNAMVLSVIYMPFATTEDTGITSVPQKSGPWLMFPGSPKAHVMLSGSM